MSFVRKAPLPQSEKLWGTSAKKMGEASFRMFSQKYNDKILSLSALTKKLTGYIVRPVQYWTYDDRNLLNIYNATYPSKG